MKKVAVIGHFGFGREMLNGQTIKTKTIAKELEKQFGVNKVLKIDTFGGIKTVFKAPFQIIKALANASNIIILPAHNGLRVYVPLLNICRVFFRNRTVHYAVIGGWLPAFLKNRKTLSRQLKRIDGIYVETDAMKKEMEEQGFENVWQMPNCKELIPAAVSELSAVKSEPYQLCTFSRVMREKGIEDAIDAVKIINDRYGRTVFTLDIYGQIDANQTKWFDEIQSKFPKYVRYGGLVPFDESVEVLKRYYVLLFPTYYEGEGFAGTVIDAMAAGLPVVASDWKHNGEIVNEKNGWLFKSRDIGELVERLEYIKDVDLADLRRSALKEYRKYTPSEALTVMREKLI